MQTYYILEDNLERLEKKLARIQNKCSKYDYTFHYKKMEPVYREITPEDGRKITCKFIPVEVFGEVKHEDWRFVATVDHHKEGNVIRQFDTQLEIPNKYRTTECVCEHCNTRRNRKETHLVYNDATQEFKQVGKSCLTEYTRGLSAELVTSYIAMFDTLIEGEAPYAGIRPVPYYPIDLVLAYAHQCVKHFGYWKTDADRSTRSRCMSYYLLLEQGWAPSAHAEEQLREELAAVPSFNINSQETKKFVEGAINFARTSTDHSSYMHNMRTICAEDVAKSADLGILISLVPTYSRHIETEAQRLEREEARASEKKSEHVGSIGERITIAVASIEHAYTSDSIYGLSFLYKITDTAGNVFTWWASNGLNVGENEYVSLVGTVRAHESYRGVKQTVLTRCKLKVKES